MQNWQQFILSQIQGGQYIKQINVIAKERD